MAISNAYPLEILGNRAVIELRGVGILSFLHNILTCSVESLNQGGLAYGALLSPQGKILHDVFTHQAGASVYLDCDLAGRDDLVAKLKLYRLRAKFEILARDELAVQVGGEGAADPRHAVLGGRRIMAGAAHDEASHYQARRFALGIADSAEIGSNQLFPHEANFDFFGGVDFKKGCYIGQEVVSRMQHRGTARSRILPVTFDIHQPTDEVKTVDPPTDENRVAKVLGRHGEMGLALVRLDRLTEEGAPAGLRITMPDWMKL